MIGKAGEIKTAILSDWTDSVHNAINAWMVENKDVNIIDIKFNSVFCIDDNHHWSHALIIYKEVSHGTD